MMRTRSILATLIFASALTSQAADIPKVLVIGIDGCRPDAVEAANTPNIDALITDGMWFEGTDIRSDRTDAADTISGPGWSNLLTGVWPDKHGVIDNKFTKPNYDEYPHFFQRLKEVRPEAFTASFSTWPPVANIITRSADIVENFPKPDPKDLPGYVAGDAEATTACIACLKDQDPTAIVLYLGQVDETGHTYGFHPKVREYTTAIERVDAHIGQVTQAVNARAKAKGESWLTIVCTDHGGSGTDHGKGHKNPEIRNVFLIVSGPDAQKGKSDIKTYQVDVVPTALKHLGVEPKPEWKLDGHAIGLKSLASKP